jgi:holo-[acyl-carrier protein] synthase
VIVGVGVDVVGVERLATAMERQPGLAARVFTEAELASRSAESLAARFAAKEAAAKALGAPDGSSWHDVEVVVLDTGQPTLRVTGRLAELAAGRGVSSWHVSLSHDAGIATAFVVAEG